MEKKTLKDKGLKACESCSYWYDDGFCMQQCYEKCQIDRYEKTQYKQLKLWELKDRLNQTRAIVSVYDLPDSIAEEIIDYSLKLIEEKMK